MRKFTVLNEALTRTLQRARLGDLVHDVVKPVAQVLKLPCLDAQGNLRPESPCGKRRAFLNGEKPKE